MILTIKRSFAVSPLCKKRPINHIGVPIYPCGKVIHPFYIGIDFTINCYSVEPHTKAEDRAVTVAGVVVVGVTVVVDIAEVGAISGVRRTEPPVVG